MSLRKSNLHIKIWSISHINEDSKKSIFVFPGAWTISLFSVQYKRLLPTTKRVRSMPRSDGRATAMQKGLVAIKVWRKQNFREKSYVRIMYTGRARPSSTLPGWAAIFRSAMLQREDPLSSVACAQAVPQMTHAKVNYTLKGFNIMKRSICMRGRPAALPHHDTTVLRVSLRATDVSWVRWAQIERSYEPNNGARSHADGLKKKGEYNLVAITEAVVASAIGVRGPFFFIANGAQRLFASIYG